MGSAGSARLTFSATSSDFQYESHDDAIAMTAAMTMPTGPKSKQPEDGGDDRCGQQDEGGDEGRGAALVLGDLVVQGR